jgi:8-oxo-dGTP pyrophosphatase MutT (NUDIX family)
MPHSTYHISRERASHVAHFHAPCRVILSPRDSLATLQRLVDRAFASRERAGLMARDAHWARSNPTRRTRDIRFLMPTLRCDVVEVYVARRATLGIEYLQLRRREEPMRGTWQPIMGHVEANETALRAMWRELWEEAGLLQDDQAIVGAWALEQVHPFFIASQDCVMMSPRFVVEVRGEWKPTLNAEHDSHRWVQEAKVDDLFVWPGQKLALREASSVLRGDATESLLRVK